MSESTPSSKPKDREFVRTREGLFFCVTGYLHPPDGYTAYLKYSPDPRGPWKSATNAYRRDVTYYHVRSVGETLPYLEAHHPQYMRDCPVRGFRFSIVPREHVIRHFDPQQRLQEILASPRDRLEEQAGRLARELAARADIDVANLGVTGSILIELHDPTLSDINLLVYGLDNAWKVRELLRGERTPPLARLDDAITERWVRETMEWFPLSSDEARANIARRWNYGRYEGRFFGIHPTRSDDEITEVYGDHVYRNLGAARIRAVVTDAREAILQPAVYSLDEVEVLDGDPAARDVRRIVSNEGRYRDIVEAGQSIEAFGMLESVDGLPCRLVVGTLALGEREFLKPT